MGALIFLGVAYSLIFTAQFTATTIIRKQEEKEENNQ